MQFTFLLVLVLKQPNLPSTSSLPNSKKSHFYLDIGELLFLFLYKGRFCCLGGLNYNR